MTLDVALNPLQSAIQANRHRAEQLVPLTIARLRLQLTPEYLSELAVYPTGTVFSVMLMISMHHSYFGTAVAIPVSVIEGFRRDGIPIIEKTVQCGDCRYPLPSSFTKCPICGGETGEWLGGWRCAAAASFN